MALILDETFLLGIPTKTSNTDPYANNVISLLRADGAANGSTTIVDSSPTPKSWAITGTATNISTTRAKFGSASLLFGGGGWFTTSTGNTTMDITTGDFTIDLWLNQSSFNGTGPNNSAVLVSIRSGGVSFGGGNSTNAGWMLTVGSTGLYFLNTDNVVVSGTHNMALGKWYHVAVTRSGNTFTMFVDGAVIGTGTSSSNMSTGATYYIGTGASPMGYNLIGNMDEVRLTKGTARWSTTFTPPDPYSIGNVDPYASSVGMYLKAGGANGSTTFTDAASVAWTPTNVTVSTAQAYRNTGSAQFSGSTTSYLSAPASTNWDFGMLDFTIEAMVYIAADSVADAAGMKRAGICGPATIDGVNYWTFYIDGDGTTTGTGLTFECKTGSITNGTSIVYSISKNAWHHIAVSRNRRGYFFSIDGVIVFNGYAPLAVNFSTTAGTQALNVGRGSGLSTWERPLNGYVEEFRITRGIARYVGSAYAPPSKQLLLHCDGVNGSSTFIDANGHVMSGTAVISNAQSKFSSTSIYFDGNSTYVSTPNYGVVAAGNWTFECFFYALDWSSWSTFLYNGDSACFRIVGSSVVVGSGISYSMTSGSPGINAWHHLALCMIGTTATVYIDGVLQTTLASNTWTEQVGGTMTIGALTSGLWPFHGYMDEIRLTAGIALYTGAFTPPTAPFASTAAYDSVSLHLNGFGSNASSYIVDWAPTTKPITVVGTAQNSSVQFKTGTTSLYFPGAGSYLTTPYHDDFNLGTGDFTFECWVWCPSAATYTNNQVSLLCVGRQDLSAQGGGYDFHLFDTSPNLSIHMDWCGTEGNIVSYYAGGTGTITRNTWHHVAVSRASGVVYMFYDGVLLTTNVTGTNTSFANTTLNCPTNQNVLIGSGGSITLPNNWPMTGYIDELRLTKGVARYTATFTPPTDLPIPNANDSYTPAALPEVYAATFGASNTQGTALTATANSTYLAVDLVSALNVPSFYDISSQYFTSSGEYEIDLEFVSDTSNIRHAGIALSPTNGSSYAYRFSHIRSSTDTSVSYWGTMIATAAWVWNTSTNLNPSNFSKFAFDNVGDRRILNLRWNSANYGKCATIEFRIDGVLLSSYYGAITNCRPTIHGYGITTRLHSIRLWNAPTVPLNTTLTGRAMLSKVGNFSMQPTQQLTKLASRGLLPKMINFSMQPTQQSGRFGSRGFPQKLGEYKIVTNTTGSGMVIPTPTVGFRDTYYYGSQLNYEIRGTVKSQNGVVNTALIRPLALFDEQNGLVVQRIKSAADGTYTFKNLSNTIRYSVIATDTADIYRAVILDKYISAVQPTYIKNIQLQLTAGVSTTCAISSISSVDLGLVETYITTASAVSVLHGNQLTDSGKNRLSVTTTSSYVMGTTAQSKFGSGCFKSDYTQWAAVTPNGNEFDFGSGNFTIEFNVKFTSWTNLYRGILQYGGWGVNSDLGWLFYISAAGTINFYASATFGNWDIANAKPFISGGGIFQLNTWYHIMVTRNGTQFLLYINGIGLAGFGFTSSASIASFGSTKYPITIGSGASGYAPFDGFIDEIIITKGTAKTPVSTFTPPTAEYTTDSATVLLLHMNGANGSTTITDSSGLGNTFTAAGSFALSNAQNKFGGTSALFGTTTANCIVGPASTNWAIDPLQSWTLELQIFVVGWNGSGTGKVITAGGGSTTYNSTNGPHWQLFVGNTYIAFQFAAGTLPGGATTSSSIDQRPLSITTNAWHHIAVTYDPNTRSVEMWLDGVWVAGQNENGTYVLASPSSTPTLYLGALNGDTPGATNVFNGYVDEVRITKGTARYSTFMARKTPVLTYEQVVDPYYYSTELMLHGEDLLDSCSNTKLITPIGTVISTSERVKIGNRSLYFNGSSWLNATCSTPLAIGTGDFTVECWVNPQGTMGLSNIFGTFLTGGTNGGSFRIQLNTIATNGAVEFCLVGTNVTALAANAYGAVNTWTHIAFSRNSGILRVFVNGALSGSIAHTSYIASISNMAVGGDSLFNFGNPTYKGYIDELRFTTYGRYTNSFSIEYLPFLDHP